MTHQSFSLSDANVREGVGGDINFSHSLVLLLEHLNILEGAYLL